MAGVVRLVSSVAILPVLIGFILTGTDEVTSKREHVDIKPTPSLENRGIERISATSSVDSQFTYVSPAYGNHPDEIQPSVSTEVDDNVNIITQRAHADLTASSVHSQFAHVSLARTYPAYGNHPDEIYPSVSAEVDFITHRTHADLTLSSAHGQFTHVSQVWTDLVYGNYSDQIQPSVSTATEMVDLLDTIPERTHADLTTPSIHSQFAHVSPAWADLVYESHPHEIHSSVSAEVGEHLDITAQRTDIQFGSSPAQIPQTTGLQTHATTFSEPVETIILVERLDLLSSSSVFAASTGSSGIPDSESSSSSVSFDRKDVVDSTSLAPVHEHNAISLSSEITSSCIIKQRHLKFTADEGEIYFEKRRETSTPYPGKHKQCTLQIEVPDTKIVHFTLFSFLANCQYFSLTVRDCGRSFRILYSFCRYTYTTFPSETVYTSNSFSNCILIQVRDNFEYQNYSLGINFTAALENSIPQLEVQFTSPMSGFIQTPGWNRSAPHPSPMDSFVRIDVPQNHSVLISFEHLDMSGTMPSCVLDILQLFLDGNDQINEVQDICGNAPPSPRLYHPKDTMYAQFKSYRNVNVHNGFRLRFTFHNYSALPEQLSDRKWNCSVPHWADFKQHIPCNLVPDCVSGEDEEDCPYSSDACGQGHFSVGGTCYRYVTSNHKLTWEEASAACLNRGERLASLSTLEKWYGVLEVLLNYGNRGGFLGLKSSNPSLPSM
ncbi:hypothetical protein BaRGS_00024307 [Batillaria attramentaria]|uniref:CUB domain-containing protein n=1 Tax=Batillaria attramentaria TaxID=370345 RepID=A0ABD0KBH8_9CAEN